MPTLIVDTMGYDATVYTEEEEETTVESASGADAAPRSSGAERGLASAAVGATVWLSLTL